jgi:hypothetical protein
VCESFCIWVLEGCGYFGLIWIDLEARVGCGAREVARG